MAQYQDDAAAVAEAEVVETAADNSQSTNDASQVEETAEQALYEDDLPEEADELDEQQDDQNDAPEPVEAPASLKAEEKEQFAQLPPEAQRFAADLLARRDRETQQGLETARTAQRQAEASAAEQVAQTQQQFAAQAAALVQAFQPEPPPIELARQNPAEYQYQKAIYDEQIGTYQALVGQIAGLHNQSEQHTAAQRQTWMQEQAKELRAIPEFVDEATRPEFIRGVSELSSEFGFNLDELVETAGAKGVLALNKARAWKTKADKWDQHQRKRNERPRAAAGRFAAAPAGNGAPVRAAGVDATLKTLYPND